MVVTCRPSNGTVVKMNADGRVSWLLASISSMAERLEEKSPTLLSRWLVALMVMRRTALMAFTMFRSSLPSSAFRLGSQSSNHSASACWLCGLPTTLCSAA